MQLRTEIEINAPPEVVWEILVDGEAYHEWNPFITTLDGRVELGGHLNVVVSPPDSTDIRFQAQVIAFEPQKVLKWKGKFLADFLFSGEHYLDLNDLGQGRTRVSHGEDFKGFLLRFLGRQMTGTARGFVFMNQALKRRAESKVNTSP